MNKKTSSSWVARSSAMSTGYDRATRMNTYCRRTSACSSRSTTQRRNMRASTSRNRTIISASPTWIGSRVASPVTRKAKGKYTNGAGCPWNKACAYP